MDVIEFLTNMINEGAKYGAINSSRAAISLISQNSLLKDGVLLRFVKETFKRRPAKPRYLETWDTEQVLTYIEKIEDLDKLKLK